MAVDMFLKLDGIDGESKDDSHTGEIEILSFSWGLSQPGSGQRAGGSGVARVDVHDITVTKVTDKSTCSLMAYCCSGKHIPTGVITARKAGGDSPVEYLKIELTEVLISSFQESGTQGDVAMENVSLNFAKFKVTYLEQTPDGTSQAGGEMGWDIKANKAP